MFKKTGISFPIDNYSFAKDKAKKFFSNNLSAYINFLISKDKEKDKKKKGIENP